MFRLSLILLTFYEVYSITTGLQVGLTEQIVNDFKNSSLPYMLNKLTTVALFKSQQFTVADGVLKVTIDITEPRVTYVNADTKLTGVDFIGQDQFLLTINSLDMYIKFYWKYSSMLGKDSGTGFITIQKSSLNSTISLSDQNGALFFNITKLKFTVSNFQLRFSGGQSARVMNQLAVLFQDNLNKEIVIAVENLINGQVINSINSQLAAGGSVVSLNKAIEFSYNLTSNPAMTSSVLTINLAGVFMAKSKPEINPPVAGRTTDLTFDPTQSQIQSVFSEYSFNTLTYAMYASGYFDTTIDSSNLPANYSYLLTTNSLNSLLPGISHVYGNNEPCKIMCGATQAPTSVINGVTPSMPNGFVTSNFQSYCKVIVISADQTAITLNATMTMSSVVYVNNWMLGGTVEYAKISYLEQTQSNIGTQTDLTGMMNFINLIINATLPIIEENMIGNGIPLPNLEHIQMTNSNAVAEDGYYMILSTPVFNF